MKFNSQICTTKEQSERLLALGLKKETADMYYTRLSRGDSWALFIGKPLGYEDIPTEYLLPAWGLHRLILLSRNEHDCLTMLITCEKAFDYIIEIIELRIKEGYFNKEYLEE